jgi:8-oxo-dGTP pyrophosphatase MutT (NUDIX family)
VQAPEIPEALFRKTFPGSLGTSYPSPSPGVKFSAVLVPLRRRENAWEVLFTRRSARLADHRGQIAFPGGRAEAGDSSPLQTALRESFEEVGIPPASVQPLGVLDPVDTSSGFRIWPVVGVVASPVELQSETAEVVEIFWIPLAWLKMEGRWEWRSVNTEKNPDRRKAVFFKAYHGHVIWGATAAILVRLLRMLREGGGG